MTARKSSTQQRDPWYEWAYQHRMELMPFYVAALVLIAGIYCALPHEWWVGDGDVLGLVTFGDLARYGPILVAGLAVLLLALSRTKSTPALVLVGTVVVGGASWAAALPIVVSRSFVVDPRTGLLSIIGMLVVLLAVTLLLGVFWWASKVNRNQAKVENEQRSWKDIAAQFGLSETTRQNHVDKPEVVRGQLVWPKGRYKVKDVMGKREELEGAMGLPSGTLRLMKHGRATDRLDYVAFRDDPQTEAEEWPGVPMPKAGEAVGEMTCKDPLPIGKTEQGREVSEHAWLAGFGTFNDMFGGDQGSGKSGGLNLRIGHLACCGDAAQGFMDFKGGVELGPWSKVGLFTITDTSQIMAILPAIRALLACRQELLGSPDFMPGRIWVPRGMPQSPGDLEQAPLFKLWVDEVAELMVSKDGGRTARDQAQVIEVMTSLVRNDRALGIGHGAATQQLGLNATADSAYRSRFNRRHCYRVGQPEEESKILGQYITAGAVDIDPLRPGTEFIVERQNLWSEPVRDYYFTDELVEQLADIRQFGGCELERYTDDAMAAASDFYAQQRAERRESMRALGYLNDDQDAAVVLPVRPEEQVRPWIAVTGPAERATDEAEGRTPDTARDIPIGDLFAAHDERRAAETVASGGAGATSDAPGVEGALAPDEAMAAAREALRQAGPEGLRASDIFRAAGRKSTWFHDTWKRAVVESEGGDGTVVRTSSGRYALTMSEQRR